MWDAHLPRELPLVHTNVIPCGFFRVEDLVSYRYISCTPHHTHAQDVDGNTALHIAVFTQHLQIITLLLDAGADPSMVNFGLFNPFIEAARNGLTAYVHVK